MSNTTAKSPVSAHESGAESSRRVAPVTTNNTGWVRFDDRGNAVWEWAAITGRFGPDNTSARLKRLESAALSLADDSAPPAAVTRNPQHAMGYCPYDNSQPGTAAAAVKRSGKKDLRRLGEWLKLREQVARNQQAED
jgi:hypothetical protein